jgi:2-hydroxy-3-oxopropionate reductase
LKASRRNAAGAGGTVVDAPLSGETIGAKEGRLSIMAGGPPEVVERLRPLSALYGNTVLRFGGTGAGSTVKACNQIVVAATVTALVEAMALAANAGLDLEKVQSILAGGLANSEVLRRKADAGLSRTSKAGYPRKTQLKDLNFVAELARHRGLKLPITQSLQNAFEKMVTEGAGNLDHTGIFRTLGT